MTLSIGRILGSLALIVFVGAAAISATGAFFSDTETSTGNTFTAGDIDLQIDNTSYITATSTLMVGEEVVYEEGDLIASPWTTWAQKNLTVEKFFDFIDLKPGDIGEDTISVHVGSNNAWVCAAARTYDDFDNTITEPEDESDSDVDSNDATEGNNGDLDTAVNFKFWVDDGDNVFESDETPFLQGTMAELNGAGQMALADSQSSVLGGNTPIPGNTTFYIGKAWCYGAMTPNAVLQDDGTDVGRSPLTDGTGWNCDGSAVGNEGQTDSIKADLEFYAVQSRNNETFTCAQYTPSWSQD